MGFKYKRKLLAFLSIICFLIIQHNVVKANSRNIQYDTLPINTSIGSQEMNINDIVLAEDVPLKIFKAYLLVIMDFENDYYQVENSFNNTVQFELKAFHQGTEMNNVFRDNSYTLAQSNTEPEAVFFKDLKNYINDDGSFEIDKIEIIKNTVNIESTSISPRISLVYVFEYGIGINNNVSINPQSVTLYADSKQAFFEWDCNIPFQNYEFQLTKKYDNIQGDNDVVDWKKALTIGTQSSECNVSLTMAEGSGEYAWRVRPVGNYFEEGIANHLNWGPWSEVNSFSYSDPDTNKNWIYNRTFTERGRIHENITFANDLLMVKQKQSRLSSDTNTLVTQQVQDFTGRPALVILPVPVKEPFYATYKKKFVRSEQGDLYTAGDYDTNIYEPGKVDNASTAGSYYNDGNNDIRIPDAQGYPYSRVLYYNDGMNRIKEEGGPGSTHMLSKDEGKGKTTKYYYVTASEDELVKLFGDEAPLNEKIRKTIQVDPNGVATITYADNNNTVATALALEDSIKDEDVLLNLSSDDSYISGTIKDYISENTKTAEGLISSKRIALVNASDVIIGYRLKCKQKELACQIATLDCNYNIEINIYDVDRDTIYEIVNQQMPDNCINGYKSVSPVTVSLEPGTYVVKKVLTPDDPETQIREAREAIKNQIEPIVDLISSWLEEVECEAMLPEFYDRLDSLVYYDSVAGNLDPFGIANNGILTNDYYLPEEFLALYDTTSADFDFDIFRNSEGDPLVVGFRTPCCNEMRIDVEWDPGLTCPADYSGIMYIDRDNDGPTVLKPKNITPDTLPDFYPDFEGYALQILENCEVDRDTFYIKLMRGWPEGTFNLMIQNMLKERYDCRNTALESGLDFPGAETERGQQNVIDTSNQYDEDNPCYNPPVPSGENGVEDSCVNNQCLQYDCAALLSCWTNVLEYYRSKNCDLDISFDLGKEDNTISDEFDEKDDGHDEHFDEAFEDMFFLIKWLAKKKMSQEIRDQQKPGGNAVADMPDKEEEIHLVKEFLDCAGYRFAKILTPYEPEPFADDTIATFNYTVNTDTVIPAGRRLNRITGTGTNMQEAVSEAIEKTKDGDNNYRYAPIRLNVNGDEYDWTVRNKKEVEIFPNIRNPIYAYKYFEYSKDPKYQQLELMTCYEDPNDCYKTDQYGYIVYDGNDNPERIPCCAGSEVTDYSTCPLCYADTAYPNLDTLINDPNAVGVEVVNGDTVKYIVNNFTGIGRIKCPYDHHYWSCGQRYTFYNLIKDYRKVSDDFFATHDRTYEDMKISTRWYKNPKDSAIIMPGELMEHEVEKLVSSDTSTFPEGSPWHEIIDSIVSYYAGNNPIYGNRALFDSNLIEDHKHVDGSVSDSISFIEKELVKKIDRCNDKCEQRESTIRKALIDTLRSRCYEIGGCRDNARPEVIPWSDIDTMVARVIRLCKSQCSVTSFTGEDVPSRHPLTPKYNVDVSENSIVFYWGVGGCKDESEIDCLDSIPGYICNDNNAIISSVENKNEIFEYHYDSLPKLSWYEYTKVMQAMYWHAEFDIASMCPEESPQQFEGCEPDSDNTAKGDTYVRKDKYEKDNNLPIDPYAPQVGEPVKSPAVGIDVTIEPE